MKRIYTTHRNILALLERQKNNQNFEQLSTQYIEAWAHFVIIPHIGTKSFPLATKELFMWLSANQSIIEVDTLMHSGCPTIQVAKELVHILGDGCKSYAEFAKKMATLSTNELNTLFENFYYEKTHKMDHMDISHCDEENGDVMIPLTPPKPTTKKKRRKRILSTLFNYKFIYPFRKPSWY